MAGAKLDLGCGAHKRSPEHVGVDVLDLACVDIVGDAYEVLEAIPDGVLEEIYSSHFFEHVSNVERLLSESVRVLRSGGRLVVVVPHFSNPYFYSDLTHRHSFGLYSFSYFSRYGYFRRQVPAYDRDMPLRVTGVRLVFKSPRPFYGRYAGKRALGRVVNLSRWTQEFYEENLCFLLPCYEVQFDLVRL
jgi:SAM-dependent methyltransferase